MLPLNLISTSGRVERPSCWQAELSLDLWAAGEELGCHSLCFSRASLGWGLSFLWSWIFSGTESKRTMLLLGTQPKLITSWWAARPKQWLMPWLLSAAEGLHKGKAACGKVFVTGGRWEDSVSYPSSPAQAQAAAFISLIAPTGKEQPPHLTPGSQPGLAEPCPCLKPPLFPSLALGRRNWLKGNRRMENKRDICSEVQWVEFKVQGRQKNSPLRGQFVWNGCKLYGKLFCICLGPLGPDAVSLPATAASQRWVLWRLVGSMRLV